MEPVEKKYNQEEQVEIVRDAMMLTATIEYEEKRLSDLKSTKFKEIPQAPVRQVVQQPQSVIPQLPPDPVVNLSFFEYLKIKPVGLLLFIIAIVSEVLFFISSRIGDVGITEENIILMLLSLVLFLGCPIACIGAIIGLVIGYKNELKRQKEKAKQSQEYQNKVQVALLEADQRTKAQFEEAANRQKALDENYQAESKKYELEVAKYNQELAAWKANQEKAIKFCEEEITYNKNALENLYNITKMISVTYRDLWILKWLYADMSSSNHSLDYAMELLDRNRERAAIENVGVQVKEAISDLGKSLQDDLTTVYGAILDNTDAIDDLHDELHQIRKGQKFSNVMGTVGVYQRWGINKKLKEMNKKMG